jgi:hypothetical protein
MKSWFDPAKIPMNRDELLNPKDPKLKALVKMFLNNPLGAYVLFNYLDFEQEEWEKRIDAREKSFQIVGGRLAKLIQKHKKNDYFFRFISEDLTEVSKKKGMPKAKMKRADKIRLFIELEWRFPYIQDLVKVVNPNNTLSLDQVKHEIFLKLQVIANNEANK